jgi:oxygen-independent coproporphyrinogen-3 oxidase
MSADLFNKYNVPGPRYTSYPAVPHWKDGDILTSWPILAKQALQALNKDSGIAIYIHLPYCESLCTYCGCNTRITVNHAVEGPYIDALCQEWDLYLKNFDGPVPLAEIHLGGGTPTFFSPENLSRLIKHICKDVQVLPDFEFSFEGHPNNTTYNHLETLRDLGFRRVSFGVQDMDPIVQEMIHRIQPAENVELVMNQSRELGYSSVNIDLVYGLPRQTLKSVAMTFDKVIQWKPDRIAFYSYAHVPWIKPGMRKFTEADLPSATEKRALYDYGRARLEEAGYCEIGMDHFALTSDPLYHAFQNKKLHRNFMGYSTTNTPLLIGLGVSAISDSFTAFAQNEKTVEAYLSRVNQGDWALFKGHVLSASELSMRKHITHLMCHFETTWTNNAFIESCIKDRQETWSELNADGLVVLQPGRIEVTEKGKGFVRNICMTLDPLVVPTETPTFSQTI